MEMIAYFQYPWQGPVYKFEANETSLHTGVSVQLPDGERVWVTVRKGYFPNVWKIRKSKKPAIIPEVIIPKDGFVVTFEGSWDPILPLIEAAAAVNTLFCVKLPPEEYEKLSKGGLSDLKERVTPRIRSLLYLWGNESITGEPCLDLYRLCGGCPQ